VSQTFQDKPSSSPCPKRERGRALGWISRCSAERSRGAETKSRLGPKSGIRSCLVCPEADPHGHPSSYTEVLGDEERGPIEGLVGLVDFSDKRLEDVRHPCRHVQDYVHIDLDRTGCESHGIV
jgi:hypothetical protein